MRASELLDEFTKSLHGDTSHTLTLAPLVIEHLKRDPIELAVFANALSAVRALFAAGLKQPTMMPSAKRAIEINNKELLYEILNYFEYPRYNSFAARSEYEHIAEFAIIRDEPSILSLILEFHERRRPSWVAWLDPLFLGINALCACVHACAVCMNARACVRACCVVR
jgi:hypothetical protein